MAILGLIKRVTRIARTNSRVRVYPARYFQSSNLSITNSLNCEDSKHPVLIVGAGPMGLVLSILLTKLGIECAVVDKATSFSKHPQAHFINNRSMEMCKKLIFNLVGHELTDLDVADIKPWVMHAEVTKKFMCCDNRVILAGDDTHRFPLAGGFWKSVLVLFRTLTI